MSDKTLSGRCSAAASRANKAVRDAWASFFWHPELFSRPEDLKNLAKTVDGLLAEGYEFVPLSRLKKEGL